MKKKIRKQVRQEHLSHKKHRDEVKDLVGREFNRFSLSQRMSTEKVRIEYCNCSLERVCTLSSPWKKELEQNKGDKPVHLAHL